MGWKPIDSLEILRLIATGNTIAKSPYSPTYKVKDIEYDGYTTIIRDDELPEIKMFPSAHLIDSKWWVVVN